MKKKAFAIVAIIVVLIILLIPIRMNLKDGGSVKYKSLVYEITKIHQYGMLCAPVMSQYAAIEALRDGLSDGFATVEERRRIAPFLTRAGK